MADSSEVDAALVNKLLSDAQLTALMPDGVYFGDANPGATKFVTIEQSEHTDEYEFQDEAWEIFSYQVKAVALSTSGGDVKAAAARIQQLLQDGSLTPTGYALMRMQRTRRIRYSEPDAVNVDLRWQHRGGLYEVRVIPTA